MPTPGGIRIAYAALLIAFLLGGVSLFCDLVYFPVIAASSVDEILSPEELKDRALISVVYRTNRAEDARRLHYVFLYKWLGALTSLATGIGLVALFRHLPKTTRPLAKPPWATSSDPEFG